MIVRVSHHIRGSRWSLNSTLWTKDVKAREKYCGGTDKHTGCGPFSDIETITDAEASAMAVRPYRVAWETILRSVP